LHTTQKKGMPMTVARWPNVNPSPGNSTNFVWARTVKGSGGGGLNALNRSQKAALFGVEDVPGAALGAAHHGFKPTRRGGCSERLMRKGGVSCAEQARPTVERNAKRREAWHVSKGLAAAGYHFNHTVEKGKTPTFTFDKAAKAAFGSWPDLKAAWVHGTWPYEWEDTMAPITALDLGKSQISVGMPMPADNGVTPAAKYYVWNALSALDAPGEYFVDTDAGKLHYIPPTSTSNELFVSTNLASTTPDGVTVTDPVGWAVLELSEVAYVKLSNLGFEASRIDGITANDCGPALVLDNLRVTNVGRTGIAVIDGNEVIVQNCRISQTGGHAIDMEAGDKDALERADHVARNNIVHHWERLCLTYQAGIAIDGVGNTIENNLLYSAPHHGIEPNGNDQLVTGNVLHHFSEDVFDNGGLYWAPDDWTDWNYTIVNNVFFLGVHKAVGCNTDTSCTRAAIYCDDGAVGGVIDSNTIWIPKPIYPTSDDNENFIDINQWGIMINGGRNWNVTNNINIDSASLYETGAGITWNADMQSSDSGYFDQMKYEKWNKPPYATHYPKLALLQDKWPGSIAKCSEQFTCPAAPWDVHVHRNVAMNATPTKDIEQLPVCLCADAGKAGNNGM
jgi:hypothetical protein